MPAPLSRRVLPLRAPPPGSRKLGSILDAAEVLFGDRGFQKAGLADIAAQAGVSKPLIYRYFRNKKHLFEAVVDRVITEWCEVILAEAARDHSRASVQLRRIIRASLEFAGDRSVLRGLLFKEHQLLLSGYSDVLERGTTTLRGAVLRSLEAGVAAGDIRRDLDPARMADVITEVCVRFGDLVLSGDRDEVDAALVATILETLLHGVVVPPDEPATSRPKQGQRGASRAPARLDTRPDTRPERGDPNDD